MITASQRMVECSCALVDGTRQTGAAERATIALARAFGARVDVVHVDPEEADWDTSNDGHQDSTASQILTAAVDRIAAAGVASVGHIVHAPDVDTAEAIADAATDIHADLVVAAPHHGRHLQRLLEPSVTDDLADRGQTALLLVR
jgi:nucleotide-binding universal stress UspA family protein